MTRPQYESAKDRAIEEALIKRFCKPDSTYKKLPCGGRYTIDFAVFDKRGILSAVVEVKARPEWERRFGDVILSLAKAHELREYEERNICEAYFLVALGKPGDPGAGVYYYRFTEPPGMWRIKWFERKDRGDPYDKEPVIHIPFSSLVKPVLSEPAEAA